MVDAKDDIEISIHNNNISVISKIEEEDHNRSKLSNSSILTISKCIDMIPEQKTKLLSDYKEEAKQTDKVFENNKSIKSGPSALRTYRCIAEQLKTKLNKMAIDFKKKENSHLINSYQKYMTNVTISKLKSIQSNTKRADEKSIYAKQSLMNTIATNSTKAPIQSFSFLNQNQSKRTLRNTKPNFTQNNINPINKLLALTSQTSPIKITIQQTKFGFKQNTSSEYNVIHISNQLQQNKKKLLFGLYKNKIEFEVELDNFKNQLEKKNKRLIDHTLYPTLPNQTIYKSNSNANGKHNNNTLSNL